MYDFINISLGSPFCVAFRMLMGLRGNESWSHKLVSWGKRSRTTVIVHWANGMRVRLCQTPDTLCFNVLRVLPTISRCIQLIRALSVAENFTSHSPENSFPRSFHPLLLITTFNPSHALYLSVSVSLPHSLSTKKIISFSSWIVIRLDDEEEEQKHETVWANKKAPTERNEEERWCFCCNYINHKVCAFFRSLFSFANWSLQRGLRGRSRMMSRDFWISVKKRRQKFVKIWTFQKWKFVKNQISQTLETIVKLPKVKNCQNLSNLKFCLK